MNRGWRRLIERTGATLRPVDLPGHLDAFAEWLLPASGRGENVVISHGGGNDRFFGLGYVAERLLASGRGVLFGNLAGHGRGGRDVFTLDSARGRLDALTDEARRRTDPEGRVVVLGQSMGATLALDQATRRTAADALVSVSAPLDLSPGVRAWRELGGLLRPSIYRALKYAGPHAALPAYRRFKREAMPVRTLPGVHYLDAFAGALEEMNLPGRIAAPSARLPPVLLVHGLRDGVVPREQADALARSLGRDAVLRIEPGVHHLDPLLNRKVMDGIIEWLDEQRKAR